MHCANTTHCTHTTQHLSLLCKWEQSLALENKFMLLHVNIILLLRILMKNSKSTLELPLFIIFRDTYISMKKKFPSPHPVCVVILKAQTCNLSSSRKCFFENEHPFSVIWEGFHLGKGGKLPYFACIQVEEVTSNAAVIETQRRNEHHRNLQSCLEARVEFTAGCSPLITTDAKKQVFIPE